MGKAPNRCCQCLPSEGSKQIRSATPGAKRSIPSDCSDSRSPSDPVATTATTWSVNNDAMQSWCIQKRGPIMMLYDVIKIQSATWASKETGVGAHEFPSTKHKPCTNPSRLWQNPRSRQHDIAQLLHAQPAAQNQGSWSKWICDVEEFMCSHAQSPWNCICFTLLPGHFRHLLPLQQSQNLLRQIQAPFRGFLHHLQQAIARERRWHRRWRRGAIQRCWGPIHGARSWRNCNAAAQKNVSQWVQRYPCGDQIAGHGSYGSYGLGVLWDTLGLWRFSESKILGNMIIYHL